MGAVARDVGGVDGDAGEAGGVPPAARSAVSRLSRALANCSGRVVPVILPSLSRAVSPARKTSREPVATTACETGRRGQVRRIDALGGHGASPDVRGAVALYSSLAMMPRWISLAPS
ncbi:hypothetical protein SGLAM104S_07870 [Streptomyces glaucescens]